MKDTTLYRKYIYDPEQVLQEQKEEETLKEKQKVQELRTELIKVHEKKSSESLMESKSTLDTSVLLMLRNYDR
jgi:hypothetical protein